MVLTEGQKQKIQIFQEILLERNQSINLISRKAPEKQFQLLLEQGLLSAELLSPILEVTSTDILDVGSGNGFPGLLLALLFPKKDFFLCERMRKRAELLKNIRHELGLNNVQILCQPAEELKKPFDLILSQASLPLEKMIKLLQKILSEKGQAFLWQNKNWNKGFQPSSFVKVETFKIYRLNSKIKHLLKVKKIPKELNTDRQKLF